MCVFCMTLRVIVINSYVLVWLSKSADEHNGYGWISSATTTALNHLRYCRNVTPDICTMAEAELRKARRSRPRSPVRRPMPSPLSIPTEAEFLYGFMSLNSPLTPSHFYGHPSQSTPSFTKFNYNQDWA